MSVTIRTLSTNRRLLAGVSASAMMLALATTPDQGHAQSSPFGRRGADPAAQAAQAAAGQAQHGANVTTTAQRAIQSFGRAAETRRQMDAAQAAARAAALAGRSNVPNGLVIGGLQVDRGAATDPALWMGAGGPTESVGTDGRTDVTVEQTEQRAILNWETFNVGRETDLTFTQGGADWVALNRVNDPSAAPSQILGSISAPGTVLILNRNGVIFGGSSQVNTRNLVAAAANLTNDQFLTDGIYSRLEFGQLSPSFTDALGDVRVEAGAQIKTRDPATVTQGGGYVMLLGANVENAGAITTNRGQTLLAAGDDFLIRRGVSTEANRYSTTRGNEANALRDFGSLSGSVTNEGVISAAEGDITLTGHAVTQGGVAISTTSVNQRGTIHLLNAASDTDGSVTLTDDSLTAILPELDSEDTAVNAQRDALIAESEVQDQARATAALSDLNNFSQFDNLSRQTDRRDQSRVEIVTGGDAVFEGGSLTLAQGGQVSVSAADRVQVQGGAEINVSGVRDVMLDMNTNAIRVNIQGNELRDAPANREADRLRNENVWVDVRDLIYVPDGTGGYEGDRYYTPGGLLEVGGTLNNQAHTIGEWSAIGGTITLGAKEVVAERGSVFDISGGSLQYESGAILNTRVLGEDGKFYDIGNAPAGVRILSVGAAHIVRHERWGERYTEVFASPFNRGLSSRYEEGYTVGRDAGSLRISAPTTVFEGNVFADVVTGERQTLSRPEGVTDGYKLSQDIVAQAGTLALIRLGDAGPSGAFDTEVVIGEIADVTGQEGAATPLPDDRINTAWLDADRLNSFGLGGLDITTAGTIDIDGALTLADGGALNMTAALTDINADVTIRGGSISVGNVSTAQPLENLPNQVLTRDGVAGFTLGEGATLDLRGVWTNGALDDDVRPSTAFIDGGDLSVRMVNGSVTLAADSVVDVSSGATLFAGGDMEGGRGGDVSLIAGAGLVEINPTENPGGIRLTLDGEIRAQGVIGGGTLTLQSPTTVVFGQDALLEGGVLPAGVEAPTGLVLAEPLTIPVGGVVPIARNETLTVTLQDIPLPSFLSPSLQEPLTTAGEWTIPDGVAAYTEAGYQPPGTVLPAGTRIDFLEGQLPQGAVIPSSAFPDGIPVQPYILGLSAGDVTPIPITYAAGLPLRSGTSFAEDVAFEPALNIDTDLLKSGFSDYAITSQAGLQITDGVDIRPEVPVLRLTAQGVSAATGADPSAALETWTPPVFLENAATGRLTQREGAGLSLRAVDLGLADGAAITVDPGQRVRLAAAGQITIEGDITAPGGDIIIVNEDVGPANTTEAAMPGRSIWIGGGATLDAAGLAYTALDRDNRLYGVVQDGGSIRIGVEDERRFQDTDLLLAAPAHVVIRDSAVLDASGASAEIDIDTNGGVPNASRRVRVAGDGGLIRLGSGRGIVIDGDMRAAAGGEGASGGTLNLVLESGVEVRVLSVTQDRANDRLAADLKVGVADPSLPVGTARISVEEIEAGGFGSLDLWSRDVISFEGDVDLAMDESLILRRGVLSVSDATPNALVSLSAPYVLLDGKVPLPSVPFGPRPGLVGNQGGIEFDPSARNTGALRIEADLIDVRNLTYFGAAGFTERALGEFNVERTPVDYAGFGLVDIFSRGDLRFTTGEAPRGALLSSGGDMILTAAQLYPTTGATGTIQAGTAPNFLFDPDGTLTIRGHGGEAPAAPLSVFGSLTLQAANIDQGGVVRAPLGTIVFGRPVVGQQVASNTVFNVILRDGGVTSTSAAGLMLPYGGTVDGLTYLYNGEEVEFFDLAETTGGTINQPIRPGVIFGETRLTAEAGSLLDLSGGGELVGAGFFTGRGGSVDVLRTALVNANPAYAFSAPDAEVYAIVPTSRLDHAPITPDHGAGAPLIGRQITLDQAVGDLPAGTYTLMPSTFALLPGAFRVELGGQSLAEGAAFDLPDGSFRANAYLGFANTDVRDVLPTAITLTPAKAVRTFSQYNETSYADFAIANAATFGALRPRLERDAQNLQIDFGGALGEVLDFNGDADLSAEEDGVSGSLFVTGGNPLEVKQAGSQATDGFTSVNAEDLNKFDAGALVIGGVYGLLDAIAAPEVGTGPLGPRVIFQSTLQTVAVRDGATVRAGQIFLTGQDILVEGGAVLDTTEGPTNGISSSLGYVFSDSFNDRNANGGAILTVANGFIDFTAPLNDPQLGPNSITIEDGAALRTLGTIGFSTNGSVSLGESELNARYLTLTVPTLNIGTQDSFAEAEAAGVLGSGVRLSESVLERLLRPTTPGQTPIERLSLTVGDSINLFGDLDFDLRGSGGGASAALVLNTPAIYGWGEAGDVARITVDTLVWNGVANGAGNVGNPFVSRAPGAVTPGGAGTGSGRFVIDADQIVFGYDPLARPQDQVELDRLILGFSGVEMNAQRITANNRGTLSVYQSGVDAASYAGGQLTLTTPLLTGDAGSFMSYRSGGALTVSAPAGATAADTSGFDALGAEVRLAGGSVTLDTAVALPSGRLVIEAEEDITLTDRADIDLSGRAITFFDVTKYSWGGDLLLESTNGAITQADGSTIDVSAEQNDAGSIKATATGEGGDVDLAGVLRGAATAGFDSGSIDVRATALGDFAGLNDRLTTGGLFEARSFVIKTGDLVVGDEVRAQRVDISIDGGSLTVDGRIDASGEDVGTIRLAARDDLTLTSDAVLDAHGAELVVDSYGQAIEASNRGEVELTTVAGSVNLASGAVIDLRSADGVARGRLEINAPRVGGDDVAINAAIGPNVRGADSIAVNAFATYTPDTGVIDQAYLDTLHADSTAFIDAANANGAVDARLAGLTRYGDAFHLRPGVEIRGDGDLTVDRDLDLSGYRYGPDIDPAVLGSGEAGVLTIRAGNDLLINGSITDGFAPPPATPDDFSFQVPTVVVDFDPGDTIDTTFTLTAPLTLGADWTIPDIEANQGLFFSTLACSFCYTAGSTIPAGQTLTGDGSNTLVAGTVLPPDAFPEGIELTETILRDGRMWAVAPMLAAGTRSWSLRLVGGADLESADSRVLTAKTRLGDGGDVVLNDPHLAGSLQDHPGLSVIRTGTGYLDVLAGGDYRQTSLFGVYTAGTQVAGTEAWNEARSGFGDGTLLGFGNEGYEATLNAQRMYFTEGGGNLMLAAQGDMRGFNYVDVGNLRNTGETGRWLWRQGGDELGQLTAWGVNFGQYRYDGITGSIEMVGFAGIGTLGGGDVTVTAGGDAGSTTSATLNDFLFTTEGLNIVVAGSGRVTADGDLIQTGGGDLTLDVGGRLNTGLTRQGLDQTGGGGVLNLRGDIDVAAGSVGQVLETGYGLRKTNDPRAVDTREASRRLGYTPFGLSIGDGVLNVASRGDLVVETGMDAGRGALRGGETAATFGGLAGGAAASFTFWTDRSALNLFSAGGDISQNAALNAFLNLDVYDPGRVSIASANGSIGLAYLLLAPSPMGDLELLARNEVVSLISDNTATTGFVAMSSGSPDFLATPKNPLWTLGGAPLDPFSDPVASNMFDPRRFRYNFINGGALFVGGPDTATNLHAGATNPIRIYGVEGDVAVQTGSSIQPFFGSTQTFYYASKPVHMRAGRDILSSGLILNNDHDDISIVRAGRDILNTTLQIAGPGVLEVSAGRNIYQALTGAPNRLDAPDSSINSIGPVVDGDTRDGAGIVLIAGVGAGGPAYADFAFLYLDGGNLADPDRPLADQAGKVVKTYDQELVVWLKGRFGYDGGSDEALAYFQALPEEQQAVFVRDVYFEELRLAGREYNNPDSGRFNSYLRGRNAIAAFLPEKDAEGQTVAYDGSITFLASAGVHTDFGGDIQVLAPGGGLTLGATGVAPPSSTGLLTQGKGDIEVFTRDSILLGLSRVFTTFGGGITMWSAEGDINAGRGAKGTVVFAPAKRTYDAYGNVDLSPTVPTSGAGIGTLNPIPEVPPGDIDLIAPLGTIDAGEAGIRVSGDVNLAALQVLNAANIEVQGEATGIPVTAAVNTGALTAAAGASAAVANEAAQLAERQRPQPIRDLPAIITSRFLGFGEEG